MPSSTNAWSTIEISSETPLPMKTSSTWTSRQAALLVVVRDRGAGGVDALGVAVALGLGQVVDHVGEDRLGRLEAERRGVADVELQDPVALGLQPLGLDQDRPAHVVAHVLQLLALADPAHDSSSQAAPACLRWCPRALTRRRQEVSCHARSSG